MAYAQYSNYFTYKFWSDHVYEGEEFAKKEAERVFQRRDVGVSTVLQMDRHSLKSMVAEVISRKEEYKADADEIFTSQGSYAYWERSGKRAKRKGPAQFRYAVRDEDGTYKIHHFDGVV
jgi:hypothetical protein